MDAILAVIYMLLGGLIVLTAVILFLKRGRNPSINLAATILVPDELGKHAAEVARHHNAEKGSGSLKWLLRRMNLNFEYISNVYRDLNRDVKARFPTAPAAEWLLDNFYIIEEQAKLIRKNLSKSYYSRLPVLKSGYLRGYPRVYAIALELVSHTDGRVDEKSLAVFLNAYQTHNMLSMGEIWAIALMLRIALIEYIRDICEKIIISQQEWHFAEKLSANISDKERTDSEIIEYLKAQLKDVQSIGTSFTEHFLQSLRKSGKGVSAATFYLDSRLQEDNTTTGNIAAIEHQLQASRQVSIGNTITSLRLILEIDWSDIFESLSHVELILRQDPAEIYTAMDFSSRDLYRHEVEKLARLFRTSEVNIARKAIECAMKAKDGNAPLVEQHVGSYLIGANKRCLIDSLGVNGTGKKRFISISRIYPVSWYLGIILLFTLFITAYFTYYSYVMQSGFSLLLIVLTAAAVLVPSSELSLLLINTLVSHMVKPAILPKLELKSGIPENLSTFVIIPTLLPNARRVRELISQLELLYLANKENNLYFALVGDFKDAESETREGDREITETALAGIRELNSKYADGNRPVFYYFHRHRTYNEKQGRWMGWERKRGAISEFNSLLRGSEGTGFSIRSGDIPAHVNIKYVITLDADTNLPIGAAKRLIGTMAHPLNSAVIDEEKRIVKGGYGLLQPRVSVSIQAANSTFFTRVFAGQGGIDPYTTAVSDIYQDLFGEGIFTGKGIYEVDVFIKALEGRIPENSVLSHDLLEGCHLRTGLVTDIELIDGYPSRYNSFSMRQHRWVRGDWQLLPWLFAGVKGSTGKVYPNPLNTLSKWKIIDNMRRSLVNPSLLLLLLLGTSILPGSPAVWITLALVTAGIPVLSNILNSILTGYSRVARIKRKATVITGFKAALYQSVLIISFIPYQAYMMLDAIIRTIIRVAFTRKNMLEWVTAADMEASLKNNAASFVRRMWVSIPAAVAVLFFELFVRPLTDNYLMHQLFSAIAAALLAALWLSAPYIAYIISLPAKRPERQLSSDERKKLRLLARKTWRYFEDFAGSEDNFMPPDNYQEEPPKGAAHRTSPTNIGLLLVSILTAYDMGYICMEETLKRLEKVLSGIEKMEKWKGHLYNWYNTITLETMKPLYVSTVDSGNFAGCMMVLRYGLMEMTEKSPVAIHVAEGLRDTLALFNEEAGKKGFVCSCSKLDAALANSEMTIVDWNDILSEIRMELQRLESEGALKESSWGDVLNRMVEAYYSELNGLYPWLSEPENHNHFANKINAGTGLKELNAIYSTKYSDAANKANSIIALAEKLIHRIDVLLSQMQFAPLYDSKRQLFSIGYNAEDGHLSKSYYDLLASEARQTSYIAIARGEVDQKHWFRLGRKLVSSDGYRGLVSWTGTMFEYLMPPLFMKSFENTLLDETYYFVVGMQKQYGLSRGIPWGISESGYMSFDINLNYQYKAFGIPELGLKRGLGNDMVIAPYASVLAAGIDPHGVISNIKRLEELGADGVYGLYEAVDFTPSRLNPEKNYSIVKSYMAHHQGMSLVAINNCINGNIMQKRFHADPRIRAAEILLQERVPGRSAFTKDYKDESLLPEKKNDHVDGDAVRTYGIPDAVLPKVHLLSNGSYSLMLTEGGSSAGRNDNTAITRWSKDFRDGSHGVFVFVQNINSNNCWSTTFEPFNTVPEKYRVIFSPDKAEYLRRDGNIETNTEITVSPEDNAEIRRISFTNYSNHSRILEVTSYLEVVLAPEEADSSHPAFSKLFVRTNFIREYGCLIASRRNRSENQKPVWLLHVMACENVPAGEIQYETDRMKFIGRNRSISNPAAMDPDQPLSNTAGSVLDPVMSLRRRIKVDPGQTVRVSYTTAVSETRKHILELAEKYSDFKAVERAFELSWTRSQVEARYLGLKKSDTEFYLDLVPYLIFNSPLRRNYSEYITNNTGSQQDLWPFGISGDIPVLLVPVKTRDDIPTVYWALAGHEYWRMKGLYIDLVFLVAEESGYHQPIAELVRDAALSGHGRELMDIKGGVFIRNAAVMTEEQVRLFFTAAQLVVEDTGLLREQLKRLSNHSYKIRPEYISEKIAETQGHAYCLYTEPLDFFNGLGGFSKDGKEYIIKLNKRQSTPAPWSNIISNPNFGFLVTETGGGFTWAGNSRENKLTPWSNDPVHDLPGEVLYIKDTGTGAIWNVTPMPIREYSPYVIRHGFGYTCFEHFSHGLEQKLTVFAALEEPVKFLLLELSNDTHEQKNLSVTYYVRPVLGVDDNSTSMFLVTEEDRNNRVIYIRNKYSTEFADRIAFVSASEEVFSFTCDRAEFFGINGSLSEPVGLLNGKLSGNAGAGYDPCVALQVKADIAPQGKKTVLFLLGQYNNEKQILDAVKNFAAADAASRELAAVKSHWEKLLGAVRVNTPDISMDIMLNGWLLYQVISCRLQARSAFYQSGGAFGFRDQLQDVMAAVYNCPDLIKDQIILHASRQFKEGDVQHWWHKEAGRGIRTRYSDDLLWLPYVTCDYIEHTEDYSILDVEAGYLESEELKENEDERYETPTAAAEKSSIYEHCVRAIERSLRYGPHGIPLMGSGDWNDGMNTVGNKGRGESIWLGWFICRILKKFVPLCRFKNDFKRAERYEAEIGRIAAAIEAEAWDGSWYRRAYFDDGNALGTESNTECKIDSIAQSWAVISGAARQKRAEEAMRAVEKYLVDYDEGIIKLLTPPFDEGHLRPGYIRGYVPGVRENGGQYTHAAVWVIMAFAELGMGEKAWELFNMINPVNHSRTAIECNRYKVEPYVMSADVYAVPPNSGRGGWSWYTGAAGWTYRVGLENILGLKRRGNRLYIDPCIPSDWDGYNITYIYGKTTYKINVANPEKISRGEVSITLDGLQCGAGYAGLTDDGGTHRINVIMRSPGNAADKQPEAGETQKDLAQVH